MAARMAAAMAVTAAMAAACMGGPRTAAACMAQVRGPRVRDKAVTVILRFAVILVMLARLPFGPARLHAN